MSTGNMAREKECSSCGSSLEGCKRYCPRCGSSAINLRAHISALHSEESKHIDPDLAPSPASISPAVMEGGYLHQSERSLDPNMVTVSKRGFLLAIGVLAVILLYIIFVLFFGMMVPDETREATASLCHTWSATSLLKDDKAQSINTLILTFNQDGTYRAFVDTSTDDGKLVQGSWSVLQGKLKLDPRLYPIGTANVNADFSFSEGGEMLDISYTASKSVYELRFQLLPPVAT